MPDAVGGARPLLALAEAVLKLRNGACWEGMVVAVWWESRVGLEFPLGSAARLRAART